MRYLSSKAVRCGAGATRFTVAQECGLPKDVMQEYFKAGESDIEVNNVSPPATDAHAEEQPRHRLGHPPGCESYGYVLDANGNCAYIDSYNREVAAHPGEKKISVMDKICLCTTCATSNAGHAGITPTASRTPRANWRTARIRS